MKAIRNSIGDYTYRGEYILRDGDSRKFMVGRRSPSGHIFYRRFTTLKAACSYVDTFATDSNHQ